MKYVLLLLIAYVLVMWWLHQREKNKPSPSFRPWYVRLKPRQKK